MIFSMTSAVLGQVRPELIQLFPSVFQDVPTGLERPKVLTFFKVGGFDRKKTQKQKFLFLPNFKVVCFLVPLQLYRLIIAAGGRSS